MGGRWVRMRNFAPVEGKVTRPVGYNWMAILYLWMGQKRFEWTGALDVSHLPAGEHGLRVRAVFAEPWDEEAIAECGVRIGD